MITGGKQRERLDIGEIVGAVRRDSQRLQRDVLAIGNFNRNAEDGTVLIADQDRIDWPRHGAHEVVGIGRAEQNLRRPAGTEPDKILERGTLGIGPAHRRQRIAGTGHHHA